MKYIGIVLCRGGVASKNPDDHYHHHHHIDNCHHDNNNCDHKNDNCPHQIHQNHDKSKLYLLLSILNGQELVHDDDDDDDDAEDDDDDDDDYNGDESLR